MISKIYCRHAPVHLAVISVLSLLFPDILTAQTPAAPFETLSFYSGGLTSFGASPLTDHWNPRYGGEGSVSTPFYWGNAETGLTRFRYDALTREVPRFTAVFIFIGWGLSVIPIKSITWYNGLRIGNYRMTFDRKELSGVKNENELAISLRTQLELVVSPEWSLYAAASLNQAYTYIRLRQYFFTFGLTYSVSTPSWLKEFLR